jgi:iron(III) transport system substrate-binding protein
MNMKRRAFLATGVALMTVAIHQAWNSRSNFAQADKVLNLYSARHYDADNQVYEGFFKKTGIKVNLVESPADKLIERVKSEGVNSPADVIITVDAGNLWRAQQSDLFQKIPASSPLYSKINRNLYDPEGYWFGFTKRARVIMYNKARVKPSDLTRYEDLANPKWKGKLLVRSSSNVYNQSLVGAMMAAIGEAKTESWVKAMVANLARKPSGNDTAMIKAVAAGEGDITIANTYYLSRLATSSKPEDRAVADKIGIIFPNQRDRGTHVNISGGGIAKFAPNKDAALKYLEYLASPEAQRIFAGSNFEYPAVNGVPVNATLTGFGKFKADSLNPKVFGQKNGAALRVMDRSGWS